MRGRRILFFILASGILAAVAFAALAMVQPEAGEEPPAAHSDAQPRPGGAPAAGPIGRDIVVQDAQDDGDDGLPWYWGAASGSMLVAGTSGLLMRREVRHEKDRMRARRALAQDMRDYRRMREGPPKRNT
jgi:hypothetical protein